MNSLKKITSQTCGAQPNLVKHTHVIVKKVQKIPNMVTHMLHCSTYKNQESQGCFSCEPPGEVL